MKKLLFAAGLLVFSGLMGLSQIVEDENGVYYAENSTPYNGTYQEYYQNGQTKVSMELKMGIKDGETSLFYEDGQIQEIQAYRNNKMHGKWITYSPGHVKTAEAIYNSGKKDGYWAVWDENGTLRCEMYYKNGQKTGVWKRFDESGKLFESKDYSK